MIRSSNCKIRDCRLLQERGVPRYRRTLQPSSEQNTTRQDDIDRQLHTPPCVRYKRDFVFRIVQKRFSSSDRTVNVPIRPQNCAKPEYRSNELTHIHASQDNEYMRDVTQYVRRFMTRPWNTRLWHFVMQRYKSLIVL